MQNSELERLALKPDRKTFLRQLRLNLFPHFIWESENSSYGKCFRLWAKIPRWIQLPFVCPHSAYAGCNAMYNETDTRCKLFLGWPEKKVINVAQSCGKASYVVQHPWCWYRKNIIKRSYSSKAKGTLFFWPHANDLTQPEVRNEELVQALLDLDPKLQPVSICLYYYDVERGLHKELEKYGIPILTAGKNSSENFVDRFYDLIFSFKYCASADAWGTQVFMSIEAGVPHFLIGDRPAYKYKELGLEMRLSKTGSSQVSDSTYASRAEIEELKKFENSLKEVRDSPSEYQKKFVQKVLSIDNDKNLSPVEARRKIYSHYRMMFWQIWRGNLKSYLNHCKRSCKRLIKIGTL